MCGRHHGLCYTIDCGESSVRVVHEAFGNQDSFDLLRNDLSEGLLRPRQSFVVCYIHFRAGLSLQVQKKIKSATVEGFNGKVINLMSNDLATFDNSVYYVHLLWKGPIEMVIFGYFIYGEIGYYGWIGIGFISCFVPIQSNRSSDEHRSFDTNPFGHFQCGWDEWPRNIV